MIDGMTLILNINGAHMISLITRPSYLVDSLRQIFIMPYIYYIMLLIIRLEAVILLWQQQTPTTMKRRARLPRLANRVHSQNWLRKLFTTSKDDYGQAMSLMVISNKSRFNTIMALGTFHMQMTIYKETRSPLGRICQ